MFGEYFFAGHNQISDIAIVLPADAKLKCCRVIAVKLSKAISKQSIMVALGISLHKNLRRRQTEVLQS